jgi:UDP-N-acetylmuramoyl-tripeptide--D-alanyl-D-alanine ligase
VRLPLVGEAAAVDFCAAFAAVELSVGRVDAEAIARSLRNNLEKPAGRLQTRHLRSGVTVLDDTYNANPRSVRAALQALTEVARGRPSVVVLGEMRELGAASEHEHASLGPDLVLTRARLVLSCGGLADLAALEAQRLGMQTVLAKDTGEAAKLAPTLVSRGDVALVKASRGVGAECVVQALVQAGGGEVPSRNESV